ncbi:MAG: hypothetical protein K0S98_980 [Propionibacteriaceae bacterium]|nr:hypothetical protein [Propionibacteriaceae bacterium]
MRKLGVSENMTLGRGCRPSEGAISVFTRSLVEARPFRSGVVLLTYRPTDRGARTEV